MTKIGRNLNALRTARPWTRADLATAAGVSERTISRIEAGHVKPKADTLAKLAAALNTDADCLRNGIDSEAVDALVESFACPTCGAPLVLRTFVDHEFGDEEYEQFECGSTRGWKERPCPKDPRFPVLADYELDFVEHDDGSWSCFARALTEAARRVELRHGHGPTQSAAAQWIERAYVEARDGHDAAEKTFPFQEMLSRGSADN